MVRGANAVDRPRYTTLADPQENPDGVWVLEANGSNYAIKGIKDGYYFNSNTNGWQDNFNAANTTGNFTFTLYEGKYSITNTGVTSYDSSKEGQTVGPWNGTGKVSLTNGYENIAVNKKSDLAPGFYIYAMPRGTYLAKASSTNPITVTGILNHPTLSDATPTGWTITRDGGNTPTYDKNLFEVFNANSFTLQQTATVPSGEYTIGVNGFYRAGTGGATTSTQNLYLFGNTSEAAVASINRDPYTDKPSTGDWSNVSNVGYVPNNMEGADYAIHTDSKYSNSLAGVTVTDGSLNLGLKRTEHIGNDWSIFNNFSLACTKLYIDGAALAYTDGATLAADTWYVYNVLSAGDYTLSATDGIVYTQNGSQGVNDDITSTAASSTITLAVGKLYIKSSAAQALTITPASYTYTPGTATANVTYIQPGNTVTVTYTGFETNNTSATLKKDFSGVTFGGEAFTTTTTDNGFTFTVPTTVEANKDYTLSIPAKAIGYEAGSTYNAAQNITFTTPAIFDGIYYLQTTDGKYVGRGSNYGTRACVNDWGLPINVATDAAGVTTLQYYDTELYVYVTDGSEVYADNSTNNGFTLTANGDGTYNFLSTYKNNYLTVDGSNLALGSTAYNWTIQEGSVHKTQMTTNKNTQAASAATSAGLTATTVSALESAVSGWSKTAIIEASDVAETKESFEPPYNWSATLTTYTADVTITKAGLYKFTIQGFGRLASNDKVYALQQQNADVSPFYAFIGDVTTPLMSVMDMEDNSTNYGSNCVQYGSYYYPNGQTSALAAFQDSKYENTIWVYLSEGTYSYGIKIDGSASVKNSRWCCYTTNSISLTYYTDEITLDEDETAAITTTGTANVTLNRKFSAGWNSIVLPFATTITELGATEAAEYNGTSGTTIKFSTTTDLKANTPYLVYFDAATTENKTFSGVTVAPTTDLTVTDAQYNFVGTYVALTSGNTTIVNGDYIVVKSGIQKANGGNVLKAFRAYFDAQTTDAAAKRMTISIDGDVVTGINAAQIEDALGMGRTYNLNGQQVSDSYKGVVIKNGKKVIRK